ncbi:hypothetical protein BD324DRAFT_648593 [Kockovaella imperatae]|uniref:ubiquitinyl hydrolase 1 n=1 Tax=Kockovaella imperatae TaxID=4999 RepID=A0A1Y1URA4_9TREE|nr:hypothetical protein BD324DRAFT_648593 [Kockovaella imperatae]ORX39976.1 hypothetical protein BD324DRAFT_648593 [Kockovaella imperatae]
MTSQSSQSVPMVTVPAPIPAQNGHAVQSSSVPPFFAPLEPLDLDKALRPIGIHNEQNTCFLNSVFQSLMATQPLISVLNSDPENGLVRAPLNALRRPLVSSELIPSLLPEALEPPLYNLLPVARAFLVALQKGWRMKDLKGGTIGYEEFNSDRSMRLNYLLREMARKYDQYDDYTQQDAHELMRHLLDSMEMEEKDVIKIAQPVPPSQSSTQRRGRDGISPLPSPLPSRSSSPVRGPQITVTDDPSEAPLASTSTSSLRPETIPESQRLIPFVDVLFGGSLASVIVCEKCRAVSHTYEPFLDISLSLKRASAERTRKRDRFKAALGLKSRGTYAKTATDMSAIASESELSDGEREQEEAERDRRKSMDDRPKQLGSESSGSRGNSLKFGLKTKPSFSWRRKGSRSSEPRTSVTTSPVLETTKVVSPPPQPIAAKSAPSSPRLSTSSDRAHGPSLTKAQMAYLRRLLADPLATQDHDPLAKLKAANSGEELPAPPTPPRTAIEQSLAAFTSVEVLEGENGYACKRCWKIKAGKYKSKHGPTAGGEDSATTSPALVASRISSPPVSIAADTSAGSLEHLSAPQSQSGHGVSRALSSASRSSAGRSGRTPSPLREHTEASTYGSIELASVKSNDYSIVESSISVETQTSGEPDLESDGLSNTSSSSEDDYSHLDTTVPTARPSMPARKKSSHFIMRRAFKRYLIAKAPEVLILHVKRFKQSQKAIMAFTNFYDLKKIDDYASFPELLDLSPYMAPNRNDYKMVQTPYGPRAPFMDWPSPDHGPHAEPVMYKLYAVVVHMGTINEGHYIAYVLVDPLPMFGKTAEELNVAGVTNGMNSVSLNGDRPVNGHSRSPPPLRVDRRVWCYCSDTSVRLASVDEVLQASAYLCFYEKVA